MAKTALVFGHTSGLGLEITKQLLTEGYRVIGFARNSFPETNDRVFSTKTDLSQEADLTAAVAIVQKEYPEFDVLIFTAGMLTAHNIDNLNYEEMEYSYKVNTFAPMFIESHLLDRIKANGTDVVNVTSSSLVDYYPKFAEYSSSKAALAKFTKDLQKELLGTNARVMNLCPSGFTSNIYKSMTGDKIERDESKIIKAADLAALVMYTLKLPKVMEVTYMYVNRK